MPCVKLVFCRMLARIYALNAAKGTLDLFEFPGLPGERDVVTLQTKNALPFESIKIKFRSEPLTLYFRNSQR